MKFLIQIDDSNMTEKGAAVQLEAQKRWIAAARKKEAVEAVYSLAGNHGAMMILNVESHEQLDELMIGMPVACQGAQLTISPLADYDVAMKQLSARFKRKLSKTKTTARGKK